MSNNYPNQPFTTVLFDLDGTVIDSGPTIMSAIAKTLADLDYPELDQDTLRKFVGPPLAHSFTQYAGVHPDDFETVIVHYRDIYKNTMCQAPIYPGIVELLQDLVSAQVSLGIATAKAQGPATAILSGLELDQYFNVICGALIPGKETKAVIAQRALNELSQLGADMRRPVLIGDRFYDIEGGAECGIETIGVEWGYGQPSEFAGAITTCSDVPSLREFLGF